jgi:hypothetical protein
MPLENENQKNLIRGGDKLDGTDRPHSLQPTGLAGASQEESDETTL